MGVLAEVSVLVVVPPLQAFNRPNPHSNGIHERPISSRALHPFRVRSLFTMMQKSCKFPGGITASGERRSSWASSSAGAGSAALAINAQQQAQLERLYRQSISQAAAAAVANVENKILKWHICIIFL